MAPDSARSDVRETLHDDAVHRGARERARAEITAEITAAARRQLAVRGASELSLRAVARELGMVSSGIYRYVANRDELLTLLIVEAYDSLGEAVEHNVAATVGTPPADRFVAAAGTIRSWATAHPNEYALVYGSPVPGYAAPQDTIVPAARVTAALVSVVADAHRDGLVADTDMFTAPVPPALSTDLDAVRAGLDMALPDHVIVAAVAAWSQIFGLVSFELFGQTRNVIEHHEALATTTATLMARLIGLSGSSGDRTA